MNFTWCIDDFTDLTGATRYVPGSHKLNRYPKEEEADIDTVPWEAEAGSAVIFESRVWHKTGNNRSADQTRAGIFAFYHKPVYRTQENWFLSLKPEIQQFASDEALTLLGYRTEGLGLVNGLSPL